jgi:hypothetical protein
MKKIGFLIYPLNQVLNLKYNYTKQLINNQNNLYVPIKAYYYNSF